MKALQPSSQNKAGSPKIFWEPPYESSAVAWKSGTSGRRSIPSHPTTSTTTSGGDGGSAILQQQLECNNNWNGTTIGRKPNKSPKSRPLFTRLLHSIFVFNLSIYRFILNVSYSLPENSFAILLRKALLRQSTAERKKERKGERKIKYCCTLPFIKFARFRLHLNRLNKFKNYLP